MPYRRNPFAGGLLATLLLVPSCSPERTVMTPGEESMATTQKAPEAQQGKELATFGAGCFWCVEAVLEQLEGVTDVTSGYTGGSVQNPSYRQVCTGSTGHAEVVQVEFDPKVIRYETLLKWFFELHDPTTLNRQGADVGTQYRSAIFYHSEEQRKAAEAAKHKIDSAGVFDRPVVTEITKAGPFFAAEPDHQDFYRQNKGHGYCRAVISPKLEKLGLDR